MTTSRRKILWGLLAGAATLALAPLRAFAARPEQAFEAKSGADALKEMFGQSDLTASDAIQIKAPDIAENGAVVPITVKFDVPDAESVALIVDENPQPLAAAFGLTSHSGGLVSTRIKMGKTSKVHAVIKAGGKLHTASKEVKVTIGGCGG